MRCVVTFLLLTLISGVCRADTWRIPNSTSPDKQYYLTIEAEPDDALDGSGQIEIRKNASKHPLVTFSFEQYGVINADSVGHLKVLWRKDSKAFAITIGTMKDWADSSVYVEDGAQWSQAAVPVFKPKYNPKEGWSDRGKGAFVVIAWLKDATLKMHFEDDIYRFDKDGQMECLPSYWVYLKVFNGPKGCVMNMLRSEEDKTEN